MVIAVQLIGGFTGVYTRPYDAAPINFWFGAAMATPLGFLIGAAWHLARAERRRGEEKPMILFLGALSIVLPLIAWLFPLDEFAQAFQRAALNN